MRPSFAARKRDANESSIVDALRAVGATVERLSGPDLPDLLVGFKGLTWIAEVKNENGKVRPGQAEWHRQWRGSAVWVLRCPEDALEMIGVRVR